MSLRGERLFDEAPQEDVVAVARPGQDGRLVFELGHDPLDLEGLELDLAALITGQPLGHWCFLERGGGEVLLEEGLHLVQAAGVEGFDVGLEVGRGRLLRGLGRLGGSGRGRRQNGHREGGRKGRPGE